MTALRDRRRRSGSPRGAPPAKPGSSAAPEAAGEPFRLGPAAAIAIALLAVAVRAAVAHQLAGDPLLRAPQLDAGEALEWARRLAGGDWRLPPYPTRGFLYPAFLAAILAASGGSALAAQVVQIGLGAATAALLAAVAARWWGRSCGVATGVVAALYAPFVLVDGLFWEEPLVVFLLVAGLAALGGGGSVGAGALSGVAIGAAACIRPTVLVLLAAWPLVALRRGGRGARPRVAAFVAAGLLVAGAGVALTSRAAGFLLPVRGYGGLNLYMGNDPEGGGVQSAPLGGAWDRLEAAPFRAGVERLAEYDRWFVRAAVARAAADPLGQARVLASKAAWLLSAEEPRDSQSFHYYRARSPLLRLLPGFALLAGFAAIGLVVARGAPPAESPAAALAAAGAAALAATLLATVIGFRYRLPVVALLVPFAGLGAATAGWELRRRRWRRAAVLSLVATAVAAASSWRSHPASHRFAAEQAQAGLALLRLGDIAAAARAFEEASATDPGSALGPDGLGMLALRAGRLEEARARFDEAIRRDPDFQRARLHRAELALRTGDRREARRQLESSLAIGPRHLPTLERLLRVVAAAGERERAAELARRIRAVGGG
jgi:tetratricopeptide (TPR) repeat protein